MFYLIEYSITRKRVVLRLHCQRLPPLESVRLKLELLDIGKTLDRKIFILEAKRLEDLRINHGKYF